MHDNCNPGNCPVNTRVGALEKEFDRYRESSSNTHKEIFDRIGSLEQSGAAVKVQLDKIEEKLDELAVSIKSLTERPGKRWDAIVDKVIWAVLAAVIAFLLGRVGL